jgi:hypothetical protein
MVGVSIRERVWLKNSLSQLEGGWRVRGGSVFKGGSQRVMTHMENIPARDLHVGHYPFTTPPSNWLKLFLGQTLTRMDTPTILKFSHYLPTFLWRWNRQSVPKRRHIKFRRRGITQKRTYNTKRNCLQFLQFYPKDYGLGKRSRHSDSLDGLGSNPGGGKNFRNHPYRPWGPPSLL